MRILVASSVFPPSLAELRRSYDVVEAVDADPEDLRRLVRDRQVIVFRSGVQITADVMARAPDLELLIRAGSGLDNIDLGYVHSHGLELVRIPEPGARAVAELTFAHMLALARQLRLADSLLRQGHWAKHRITGHLLEGKTLGVIGAGNIGSQVGRLGAAWGMRVLGSVAHPSPARAERLWAQGIDLVSTQELLEESDFVSVHVPLDETTRGLVDEDAIASMKQGVVLVNMARGGVVDELALERALDSGHVAGAGCDVHEHEGEGAVSPLARFDNVILTPHMGAGTVDSQRRIGERILETLRSRRG